MRLGTSLLIASAALAVALLPAVTAAQSPFPFPFQLPFIPLAPQPDAVQPDSEGWRAIVAEFGAPVKGPQAQLVEDVVAELSRGAGRVAPRGGYRGTLLDTPVLNAFAIGDGNVFVTRELLAYMNDEDELIGVLGHEVGHVIGGHSRFSYATNAAKAGEDRLFGVFLPPLSGIEQLGTGAAVSAFSRAQEHAADAAGVKFLADLGRDPTAMGRALGILDAASKLQEKTFGARPTSALDYWLDDHPIQSERLAVLNVAVSLSPRGRPAPHRSPDAFVRALDGLAIDDGPEQGIVDGGRFRHPVLKFGLDAPAGFRMLNTSSALLLKAPGGSSATLKMTNGGGSAQERFKAAWIRSFSNDIPPPTPEATQSGGIAGASGFIEKRVDDATVRISLWLYPWSDTQSFIYASVDRKGADTQAHAAAARSFRRLSDDEARSVQVRRIRIVDVAAGDSVASLSGRMAYADFREERFRLINGLFNGEPLPKSGPVKLVVWSAP